MADDVRSERTGPEFDDSKKVGEPTDIKIRMGIIMDNQDPTLGGKVWVFIETLGTDRSKRRNWKAVSYSSPYFGVTNLENNNKGFDFCNTQQSYGFWGTPPDIGSLVLIGMVDGEPDNAWIIGCVPDAYMHHMVPGIASSTYWDPGKVNKETLKPFKGRALPVAEYNKKEKVASAFKKTLKPVHMPQFEMLREQGLILDGNRGHTSSSSQRESPSRVVGLSTPGRPLNSNASQDPFAANLKKILKEPQKVKESELKVWNRKGGHTLVMDDGDVAGDNHLMRLRSSTGHQILLHDSGEFMYIANAKGTAWIEINDNGIDVFSTGSISMHTEQDFNFDCFGDMNVDISGSLNIKTGTDVKIETPTYNASTTNYNVTSTNMDLSVTDYDRKATGITTRYFGDMSRTHTEKDTFITTGAGTDFSPSSVCPVRDSDILTACEAPPDPLTAATPQLYNTQFVTRQTAEETAKSGLKWAPGGGPFVAEPLIQTISKRTPQHEPWNAQSGTPV